MLLRRLVFIGGALALVALAAQNANGSTWALSLDVQFLLLAGGIAGVAWGLGDDTKIQSTAKTPCWVQRRSPREKRFLFLALGLITLLAFVVRVWQLETSVHYFVDELNFVEGVVDVMQARQAGEVLHLVHPFHWLTAFPRLFPYWQSWGVALAGQNYTGFRLASAVLGTLTVPAVYLLGKHLFDKRVGLLAALLLATFPPHIHFSRLGLNNVADPLFGTLALAFLARGLREGKQGDFALAGVMLGMTQYFYEGGRLLYPIVVGLWLAFSIVANRQVIKKTKATTINQDVQPNVPAQARVPVAWRNVGVFVLAFALSSLPLYTVNFTYNLGAAPRLASSAPHSVSMASPSMRWRSLPQARPVRYRKVTRMDREPIDGEQQSPARRGRRPRLRGRGGPAEPGPALHRADRLAAVRRDARPTTGWWRAGCSVRARRRQPEFPLRQVFQCE